MERIGALVPAIAHSPASAAAHTAGTSGSAGTPRDRHAGVPADVQHEIEAFLLRAQGTYGEFVDEAQFAVRLSTWLDMALDHPWLTAEYVQRAAHYFLYQEETGRRKTPTTADFLTVVRPYREADARRAAQADEERQRAALDARLVLANPDDDEDVIPRPPPDPNVVTVQWADGQTSTVRLRPAERYPDDATRARRAKAGPTDGAPLWLECLCGKEVYEYPSGVRQTPDGRPHNCKWTILARQERRERGRAAQERA